MDLIKDAVRWILWTLVKGAFFLMDSIYSMIRTVISFDIGTATGLWDWWLALCSLMVFFIFIRIVALYLHNYINEENAVKSNPVGAIFRIGIICAVMALMPIIVPYFTAIGADSIEKFDTIFITGETFETQIPKTDDEELNKKIEESYAAYAGMPSKLFMDGISNGKYPLYNMININETAGGMDHWFDGVPVLGGIFNVTSAILGQDGDYVYLPDTTMLIFLLVEALCAAYLFFMMGIQIAQRIFSIGMKILISVVPISGLVNPDDQSFGIWAKLMAGDMITNFAQYMLMKFVLMVSSSAPVIAMGPTVQPFLFLGGMLCVLVGPGAIAQIIGGDGMGVNNTLQAMQSMRSMAHTGAKAMSYAAGGMAMAGAAGVYAGGRMLGGKSLSGGDNDMPSAGGGHGHLGGMPLATDQDGFGGRGSTIPPKAFSEEPTAKQASAAEKQGIDITGMSKGQVSQALEKAGFDKSYWSGRDDSGFSSFNGGANGTINDSGMGNYGFSNAGAAHTSGASDPSATSETGSDGKATNGQGASNPNEARRMTRDGSIARRYADKASSSAQSKGRPVARNLAVAGASGLYKASANRLFGQRTVMRRGQYIQRNTRPQSLANLSHTLKNSTQNPAINQQGHQSGEFSNPDNFDPYQADQQGGNEL